MPSIWDEFLNRDIFNWGNNYSNSGTNVPAVNIKENADSFNVEMPPPVWKKKILKLNWTDTP